MKPMSDEAKARLIEAAQMQTAALLVLNNVALMEAERLHGADSASVRQLLQMRESIASFPCGDEDEPSFKFLCSVITGEFQEAAPNQYPYAPARLGRVRRWLDRFLRFAGFDAWKSKQ